MIWSLMLTACMQSTCVEQSIQWFEDKQECIEYKLLHEELPKDGNWSTVDYVCTLVNGVET